MTRNSLYHNYSMLPSGDVELAGTEQPSGGEGIYHNYLLKNIICEILSCEVFSLTHNSFYCIIACYPAVMWSWRG